MNTSALKSKTNPKAFATSQQEHREHTRELSAVRECISRMAPCFFMKVLVSLAEVALWVLSSAFFVFRQAPNTRYIKHGHD